MSSDMLNKFWLLTTFILVILIFVTGFLIWNNRDYGQELIIFSEEPYYQVDQISINGAVSNPGTYSLYPEDSLNTLIRVTGGLKDNADITRISLLIPAKNEIVEPQKVDLNRAELWLLQALPGIGEARAQAIIEYRTLNGPFNKIEDLTKVPGIGDALFEKIRTLISVTETKNSG